MLGLKRSSDGWVCAGQHAPGRQERLSYVKDVAILEGSPCVVCVCAIGTASHRQQALLHHGTPPLSAA